MEIKKILTATQNFNWQKKLLFIADNFNEIAFSTSFSIEDQVITDFIATKKLDIEIFTIDTARLPKSTYSTWQSTLDKYQIKIKAFYPDADDIANFVNESGINAFYESKDLRLKCCEIRKIKPLKKALKNKKLWISGLRKEHSKTRFDKDFFEKDEDLNLVKFYPLLEISEDEIWQEINQKNIPFNQLYKQGYRSIGCDPCSRAISKNDDVRAGRWWWENDSKKECGLHSLESFNNAK
jgi:phosphoadenosine phosphosulfate reductase